MNRNRSPLDNEPYRSIIVGLVEAGETNASIARILEEHHGILTTNDSIRRFRQRHGVQIPGTKKSYTRVNGDSAEAATEPVGYIREMDQPPILDDPDAMLRDRGLDPEAWKIDDTGVVLNTWDGPQAGGNIVRYYQAKFRAVRRRPDLQLQPVRSDGWKRPETAHRAKRNSELVVIMGDAHAPFHDKRLHALSCQFLKDVKPDRGVDLGDLLDYPDISRHKDDPENVAYANECGQAGYDILRGRAKASPATQWEWMPGNHDMRLRNYLIEKAPRVYEIERVATPEEEAQPVNRINYLLRLDELGVKWVDPHGSYEDAQVELGGNLAIRHGWIVRQGSGTSALKSLEATGYSLLIGHTHRQSIVHHTFHEIDGQLRVLMAGEIGCMCRLDPRDYRDEKGRRYPNYATLSNWQQGFATAEIYPDGFFRVDLASYVNDVLMWRDRRYE